MSDQSNQTPVPDNTEVVPAVDPTTDAPATDTTAAPETGSTDATTTTTTTDQTTDKGNSGVDPTDVGDPVASTLPSDTIPATTTTTGTDDSDGGSQDAGTTASDPTDSSSDEYTITEIIICTHSGATQTYSGPDAEAIAYDDGGYEIRVSDTLTYLWAPGMIQWVREEVKVVQPHEAVPSTTTDLPAGGLGLPTITKEASNG